MFKIKVEKEKEDLIKLYKLCKERLVCGETIKNFKELCKRLDKDAEVNGNSKRALETIFGYCFRYEKIEGSQKIRIYEIYEQIPDKFFYVKNSKEGYGKIYKITNNFNNKVYIGQTIKTLNGRLLRHKHFAMEKDCRKKKFYSDMIRIGLNNFKIELIEDDVPVNELNERENYWIDYYNSIEEGYNSMKNGDMAAWL